MSFNNKKSKNIPAFLQKTYNMLEDQKNDYAIQWAPNGVGFIILNEELLTKKVLPTYFKHSNYSSFIRQLNMYDFHKIRKGTIQNYFHHDLFIRFDLLSISKIKRKPQKKKTKYPYAQEKPTQNRTQITLNSFHTLKQSSQQSIIKSYKKEQIFYQDIGDKYSRQYENQESQEKMSINNQIGNQVDYQVNKPTDILVPSHNIFHFINSYQLANFGIFI